MESLDDDLNNHFEKPGIEIPKSPGRISYGRQKSARLKPRSKSDLLNQQLLAEMKAWLKPLEAYLKVGYRNYPGETCPMAAALREANKCAAFRHPSDYSFLPPLVPISYGDLAFEDDFKVLYNAYTSELCIYWDIDMPEALEGQKPASEDDRVMVVARRWSGDDVYGKVFGARRGDCCERVAIPREDDPNDYYIYVAFTSADGTTQSGSYVIAPPMWELPGALSPKISRKSENQF